MFFDTRKREDVKQEQPGFFLLFCYALMLSVVVLFLQTRESCFFVDSEILYHQCTSLLQILLLRGYCSELSFCCLFACD